DDVVGGEGAVGDGADAGPVAGHLPERDAADVGPVVDADDGLPRHLTGGVGGLDAGVEREAELDEAEQQKDQQRKQQCELDRGRAVLSPVRHSQSRLAHGCVQLVGFGPLATQSPTTSERSLTVLNRAKKPPTSSSAMMATMSAYSTEVTPCSRSRSWPRRART